MPKDDNEFKGLAPDHVPGWLTDIVRGSQNFNMSDLPGLTQFFDATDAIKSDQYDQRHFTRMRDEAEELNGLATSRFVDDPAFFDLIQDEFLGLYKAFPKLRTDKDMRPTHKINRAVMDRVQGLRDWSELRTYTELDEWAAAMAAVDFGLKLADILDEMRELADQQKAANDAAAAAQKILDALQGTSESDRAEELLGELQQALQALQDAGDGISKALDAEGADLRQALRGAVKDTLETSENLGEMLEAFGTEPGALQRMDGEERLQLARRIMRSAKLKELADKVGRFVRLALGEQARKIKHGFDEVHDVTLSNDVSRALPSELSMLGHRLLKNIFYVKLAQSELLTYEMRGTEKVARGAVIAMIDSSGSMQGPRETWAKAVAIALLNIAHRQGRDFHCIIFGSRGEIWETNFPKGRGAPNQVLDMAEFAFYGGTDFETPFNRGITVLEKQYSAEGSQKGDLVMITDGECAVSDEWLKWYMAVKERLAFRTYGCLIGVQSPLLDTLSDVTYNITDLADGIDAREIFGYV